MIAGGGTLGSTTPLLAIAETIQKKNSHAQFLWIGTKKGPEEALVQSSGMQFAALPVAKLRRYRSVKNISDIARITVAFTKSLFFIARFKPDCIIGAGSFVQVPVVYAARILSPKTRIIIHQQDIQKGLANRLCEQFAHKITVATKKSLADFTREKTVYTGNPYRREILEGDVRNAFSLFHLEKDVPTVLILGGSAGAQALNNIVIAALPALTKFSQILHITGRDKEIKLERQTIAGEISRLARYHRYAYLTTELPHAYAIADVVVSRAGFATLTELAALAKPAILIPMPGTHQECNASYFESAGATVALKQTQLTPELFAKRIQKLVENKEERFMLSSRIHGILPQDANERFVREIVALFDEDISVKNWNITSSGNGII